MCCEKVERQSNQSVIWVKDMLDTNERQQEILKHLSQHKFLTVTKLTGLLFASEATIRRDLKTLEQMHLVTRECGGVRLREVSEDLPLSMFNRTSVSEKHQIAMQAVELIHDGEVLFLDATSTTSTILEYIGQKKTITIFTNGLETAQHAADAGIETYIIGGQIKAISSCTYGSFAVRFLNDIHFDTMFFSVPAISAEGELSHFKSEVVPLYQALIPRSKRKFLLCISGKYGKIRPYRICHCSELTAVISERDMPAPINMLSRVPKEVYR